jgi:hypothetical protein
MIDQKYWVILPYSSVEHYPYLRISPMGVVLQKDCRPQTIVDYSFSGVNQATLLLAPEESMQFGRALENLLQRIHLTPLLALRSQQPTARNPWLPFL